MNLHRVRQGLPIYPSVERWLEDYLQNHVKEEFKVHEAKEANQIRDAYVEASDEVREAVRVALGRN